jgi:hypothetical protein
MFDSSQRPPAEQKFTHLLVYDFEATCNKQRCAHRHAQERFQKCGGCCVHGCQACSSVVLDITWCALLCGLIAGRCSLSRSLSYPVSSLTAKQQLSPTLSRWAEHKSTCQ